MAIDTVTLNIIHNALTNIASEMALVMLKTSYSTIFNEGLDFTTVLLDRHGDLIAEKNYTPSMMGAIPHTVKWAVEEKGIDHFHPGDVLVHNDCYRGGCHLPEHMMMRPMFVGDHLFGFAGNIGHVAEIGGKAPGSFAADATDIYQEGLRLPPVKLIDRGEYVEDVWRIVLANHRTPHNTWGDFHAMIGSLETAERRIRELAERYDPTLIEQATAELMDYSERRLRAEIRELPDGEYSASMLVEDDGVTADPFEVRVTIVIDGDEIIADFTGTSPQVRGPMNCTVVVVASAIYNAVFSVTDPHSSIPRNSGCYRPIKFIAPAGSVVNVVHPGPCVGGNTDLQPKLIDLLLKAFSSGRAGASRCGKRRLVEQFPLRRHPPSDRGLLHELPLRRARHRRHGAEGRQQRRDHPPLQLPQHADRGLRGPLPLPHSGIPPDARLRRPRRAPRRAFDHAHAGGDGGRDHAELPLRPGQDPRLGTLRRKIGGLSQLLVKRVGDDRVPHLRRGLPHGLADEVHQRPAQARRHRPLRDAGRRRLRRSIAAGSRGRSRPTCATAGSRSSAARREYGRGHLRRRVDDFVIDDAATAELREAATREPQ